MANYFLRLNDSIFNLAYVKSIECDSNRCVMTIANTEQVSTSYNSLISRSRDDTRIVFLNSSKEYLKLRETINSLE